MAFLGSSIATQSTTTGDLTVPALRGREVSQRWLAAVLWMALQNLMQRVPSMKNRVNWRVVNLLEFYLADLIQNLKKAHEWIRACSWVDGSFTAQ